MGRVVGAFMRGGVVSGHGLAFKNGMRSGWEHQAANFTHKAEKCPFGSQKRAMGALDHTRMRLNAHFLYYFVNFQTRCQPGI
jgi:hypothetical protein